MYLAIACNVICHFIADTICLVDSSQLLTLGCLVEARKVNMKRWLAALLHAAVLSHQEHPHFILTVRPAKVKSNVTATSIVSVPRDGVNDDCMLSQEANAACAQHKSARGYHALQAQPARIMTN